MSIFNILRVPHIQHVHRVELELSISAVTSTSVYRKSSGYMSGTFFLNSTNQK